MERSPQRGTYRSPWAVKKVARRFAGSGGHQDFSRRLLQEAEILRTLQHPNIIGYRTLTKAQDGAWCLAMERAHHCLMDLIEERLEEDLGAFPSKNVELVAVDVAKALAYLHGEKQLMHGDLKSGNVLIFSGKNDEFQLAKLCDFGVALPLAKPDGAVKSGHYYVGTQAWSAPEVIQDAGDDVIITAKADMFSYGLTLWEMLSLQLPHADLLDDDEEEEDGAEDAYKEALGSRPPLPVDLINTNGEYSRVIAVFIAATEALPSRRPKASDILRIFDQ